MSSTLKILPVLDLLGGQIVRGVSGNRKTYQPIDSLFCRSAKPLEVAHAFREQFGFAEFYLADLDAIEGGTPDYELYENLLREGFRIQVDAGDSTIPEIQKTLNAQVTKLILDLECCPDAEFPQEVLTTFPEEKFVFSIDLKGRQLFTEVQEWKHLSAVELAQMLYRWGFRELILLDLLPIGQGEGVSTLDLTKKLRQEFPNLKLTIGGGVRNVADLVAVQKYGANSVLVSTAFHHGTISPQQLREFSQLSD